jgi:hypothetical protein
VNRPARMLSAMIDNMRLPRGTMPEDEFWQLIAVLDGSTQEEAVERLTQVLRAGGRRTAIGFAERLAATLYELDRESLFRQPVRWSDDPDDSEPIPLSGDTFLYLRADIVAKGKAVVEQVLADPAVLLTRRWDDGEALLYAPDEALGSEIETTFSYESCSNEQYWSPVELDSSAHQEPIVVVFLSDLHTPIVAYTDESLTSLVDPADLGVPPLWFPMDVWAAAATWVDNLVRQAGGIPVSLGAAQIQIFVGFGDSWQLTPIIEWTAMDDTGLGQVVKVRVHMRQAQVRVWKPPEQLAALRSLIASCCLAVLPEDHGSRSALHPAVTEGARFLPPSG